MSPAVRREAVEVLFGRLSGIEAVIGGARVASHAARPSSTRLAEPSCTTMRIEGCRTRAPRSCGGASRRRRAIASLLIASYRPALALAGRPRAGARGLRQDLRHLPPGRGPRDVDVGPDLATVTGRSAEDLLVHILDPNREVAPNYVNYNVAHERRSGRIGNHRRGVGRTVVRSSVPRASPTMIPRDQIEADHLHRSLADARRSRKGPLGSRPGQPDRVRPRRSSQRFPPCRVVRVESTAGIGRGATVTSLTSWRDRPVRGGGQHLGAERQVVGRRSGPPRRCRSPTSRLRARCTSSSCDPSWPFLRRPFLPGRRGRTRLGTSPR